MRKLSLLFNVLAVGLIIAAVSSQAQAQSNRTWVSSTGSDVANCSRATPCATFNGALAKTNPGGEISVVDSGAYGNVTITQAVTIDGGQETALITSSGAGAVSVTVNAASTDTVILRRLNMNGINTGKHGILFNTGKELHVESCVIKNFQSHGINFSPTTSALLFVQDTSVSASLNGAGIYMLSGTSGISRADITGTRLQRNLYGILMERTPAGGTAIATVSKTVASCEAPVGGALTINTFAYWVNDFGLEMNIQDSVATQCRIGVRAIGGTARISNTIIASNLLAIGTQLGQVISAGNNAFLGNGGDGDPVILVGTK
jgi:hypothetical protein